MSKEIVERFIASKSYAWSESTKRNEAARLGKVADAITGDPVDLIQELQGKASYTFVSIFNRVIQAWDFAHPTSSNPYLKFKQENSRLFRNYYQRKAVDLNFEEARERLQDITCRETYAKAMDLLFTGMRFSESQEEQDGYIVGKGGKLRKVFRPSHTKPVKYSKHYTTFNRELSKVGLSAHMLRKLAATRLVELGLKEHDLLKVMGWSNLDTAKFYLQPKQDEEIGNLMEAM